MLALLCRGAATIEQNVTSDDCLPRSRNNANGSNGHRKSKGKTQPDVTQLIEAFQITESAGTVNVVNALYGLLLHQGVPSRSHSKPPQLLDNASSFTLEALQLLHRLALLDLNAFQVLSISTDFC